MAMAEWHKLYSYTGSEPCPRTGITLLQPIIHTRPLSRATTEAKPNQSTPTFPPQASGLAPPTRTPIPTPAPGEPAITNPNTTSSSDRVRVGVSGVRHHPPDPPPPRLRRPRGGVLGEARKPGQAGGSTPGPGTLGSRRSTLPAAAAAAAIPAAGRSAGVLDGDDDDGRGGGRPGRPCASLVLVLGAAPGGDGGGVARRWGRGCRRCWGQQGRRSSSPSSLCNGRCGEVVRRGLGHAGGEDHHAGGQGRGRERRFRRAKRRRKGWWGRAHEGGEGTEKGGRGMSGERGGGSSQRRWRSRARSGGASSLGCDGRRPHRRSGDEVRLRVGAVDGEDALGAVADAAPAGGALEQRAARRALRGPVVRLEGAGAGEHAAGVGDGLFADAGLSAR